MLQPKVATWTWFKVRGIYEVCRIKRDQLDVTCFIISLFNAQHFSEGNTSILRSLRLICWVISWVVLFWFDVCWCYVAVWLGWCGIRMQAKVLVPQPAYGLICWVISWVVLLWFNVCWCYVVVWLWGCGIRMQTEVLMPQPAYGLICWVISWVVLLWFDVCWCYVVVWLGGVVSVCRLRQ